MIIFSGTGGIDVFDTADLELWIRASSLAGASDGNPVHPLTDISGNSRDAFQTVPDTAKQATYHATGGANNKPYLSFDGGDEYEVPNFMTGFAAGRLFIVERVQNDPALAPATCIGAWGVGGTGSDRNTLWPFTDGNIHDSFGTDVRRNTGNPSVSLTSWRLYEVLSKPGEWTSWIDGTQHFTTASNTVTFSSIPLLGRDTGGNHFLGDLHEILFFGADISSSVVTNVRAYIASEYALTIA